MSELEQRLRCACCGGSVKTGTNGYQGGDAGHGSFAYVQIEKGNCKFNFDILNGGSSVKITACGDEEIDMLVAMLEEATSLLRKQGVEPDEEFIAQLKK